MRARVWVDEWQIGDWPLYIRPGDRVDWDLFPFDPSEPDQVSVADLIGEAWTETITHDYGDPGGSERIAGQVATVYQVRVRYPSRFSGDPTPGSGVIGEVERATLMGDRPDADGLTIYAYLVDVEGQRLTPRGLREALTLMPPTSRGVQSATAGGHRTPTGSSVHRVSSLTTNTTFPIRL